MERGTGDVCTSIVALTGKCIEKLGIKKAVMDLMGWECFPIYFFYHRTLD